MSKNWINNYNDLQPFIRSFFSVMRDKSESAFNKVAMHF